MRVDIKGAFPSDVAASTPSNNLQVDQLQQPSNHNHNSDDGSNASPTEPFYFFDAEDSTGAEENPSLPFAASMNERVSNYHHAASSAVFSDATTEVAGNTSPSDPYTSSTTTIMMMEGTTKGLEENRKTSMWTKAVHYIKNIPDTWPRLCSLAFGVVCPVLSLIAIALFFGFFLAHLESAAEISNNNAVIGQRDQFALVSGFLRNVGGQVGSLCLGMMLQNLTDIKLEGEVRTKLYEIYAQGKLAPFNASEYVRNGRDVDADFLFAYMSDCGETVWNMTEEFTGEQYGLVNGAGSLTFNWIRCYSDADASDDTFNQIFGSYVRHPLKDVTQLRPYLQESAVVDAWHMDQQQLEQQYLEELNSNITDGEDYVKARVAAYRKSIEDADGFDNCETNPDAGAWFWFTVMTTIGYGNTTPKTTEGRMLVFTVGFLSILIFALVLGNAGRIVTAIFDDWLSRVKVLSCVRQDWIMCLFWGGLYYFWMSIVALETVRWKKERLDEDFSYQDAYWFAFITTTTVGLGDYYLEHQVVLRRDLIAFSLMILMGFVFLANFLVKMTELLTTRFPRMKASNLDQRLQATNMLWHFSMDSIKTRAMRKG